MANLTKTIQEALVNLPADYRQAIKGFDINGAVELIADRYGLTKAQAGALDKEVVLLVLGLQDSVRFMTNIEQALDISEDMTADITNAVTENILKPLRKRVDREQSSKPDIPTPPSNSNTPGPSYGGQTDPYREPAEE